MREIKFRFWNYVEGAGRMFYDVQNVMECLKQQVLFNHGSRFGYNHVGDGSSFMQFTGLRDKNGKEIYEGDICLKHYSKDLYPERKPDIGFVKWVSFGARFTLEIPAHKTRSFTELWENLTDKTYERSLFEVIGNIYDNPELLNP